MKSENIIHNRTYSLFIISMIYVLAIIMGIVCYNLVSANILLKVAAADVSATLVVFIFSLVFRNSSVYDPYWSVAPPVIIGMLMFAEKNSSAMLWLLFGIILIWSVRLTFNWAKNFKNLSSQDWRYTQYKQNYPKIWLLSNLFGIHLIPTVIVYLCLLPAVYSLRNISIIPSKACFGAVICIIAIIIQYISDTQMYNFRQDPDKSGNVNRKGLWKYSRHPNYLGEIFMWWGVFFIVFSSGVLPLMYITGAVANTALFMFISIPLMEKRQITNKSDYLVYKQSTSMLFLLPPRNKNENHG